MIPAQRHEEVVSKTISFFITVKQINLAFKTIMFSFHPTPLQGAALIDLPRFEDERGIFIKTFQESIFLNAQLPFTLRESYYSYSKKDVVRGMHFQLPPHQHAKIVFCPQGKILDVVLDLRKKSKTYRQFFATELSAENHKALFIPEGFAHGFKALTDHSMTYYLLSSEHHKESDTGIKWDSFAMDWAIKNPIISRRDASFPALADFDSPF